MACAPDRPARRRRRASCWRATASTAQILHWSGAKPRAGLQEAARDGALPAVARRMPPARHPAPAARPPCRRPGRDRGHARCAPERSRRSGRHGGPGRAARRAPAAAAARGAAGPAHRHAPRARRAVARRSLERRSALRAGAAAGGWLPCVCGRAGAAAPNGRSATAHWPQAAVDMLEFDQEGVAAIDRAGFARLGRDLQARLLSRVIQAVGGRDHPPRRDRLERAARRLCAPRGAAESPAGARISRFPAAS